MARWVKRVMRVALVGLVAGLVALFGGLVPSIAIGETRSPDAHQGTHRNDCVIVLHGMARTYRSMRSISGHLRASGFAVVNAGYDSGDGLLAPMAERAIGAGITSCGQAKKRSRSGPGRIHFVTHSLGGILVRQYYSRAGRRANGRVVMIAPPNQGSEVVDNLGNVPGFELLNGPVGRQLSTARHDPPRALGEVPFQTGVIAGTRSYNWFLSTLLPNPDDGKVSLYSARVSGMCAFLAVPASHPFIMNDRVVHAQVVSFLRSGRFTDTRAEHWPINGSNCDYQAPGKPLQLNDDVPVVYN